MKRNALIKHLRKHGCSLVREGGRHSWWGNLTLGTRSSVPRHGETKDILAQKICKDLNIPKI
ncbi:MAG: type II toxin-antitoxin system HicA family toxin [Kiritimatiellia bacterium]